MSRLRIPFSFTSALVGAIIGASIGLGLLNYAISIRLSIALALLFGWNAGRIKSKSPVMPKPVDEREPSTN